MTAVAEASTFQERMFERIKSQMGELMTAEELKALVEKATHEAFFKTRTVVLEGYPRRTEEREAAFVELMREELRSAMTSRANALVEQWFKDHPDIFQQSLNAAIEKGFAQVVLGHINNVLAAPLQNLGAEVWQLNQRLNSRGL